MSVLFHNTFVDDVLERSKKSKKCAVKLTDWYVWTKSLCSLSCYFCRLCVSDIFIIKCAVLLNWQEKEKHCQIPTKRQKLALRVIFFHNFSQRETGSDWHCLSKTHLSFPRPACGILTWRNLKGLAELANLTVKFEVKFWK